LGWSWQASFAGQASRTSTHLWSAPGQGFPKREEQFMSFSVTRVRLGLASATVAAGLACSGIAASSASAATSLRILYNANPTNTTVVVAQQQGFFKKNGLNVTLMPSTSTGSVLPALGKQFDMMTITPTQLLQAAAQGFKDVLVGSETIETSSLESAYLIAKPGITTVAQLKGQKVGVVDEAGALYASFVIRLHRAGLKPSDVTFVPTPFPDMASAMESGAVSAVVTIYPFQGLLLGKDHDVNLGNPVEQAVGFKPVMDAGWASTAAWAASHKSVIQKFQKAQQEALAWMKANTSQAQALLETSALGQLPSFVATQYNVTGYVSLTPQYSYLAPWVNPLYHAGQLKKKLTKAQLKALLQ
jgi:NitT/TauT family transport system substrate-binding protein